MTALGQVYVGMDLANGPDSTSIQVFVHPAHGAFLSEVDFAQIEMRIASNMAIIDPLPFMEMDDYDDAFEYGVRTVEEVLASQLWKKTRHCIPCPE